MTSKVTAKFSSRECLDNALIRLRNAGIPFGISGINSSVHYSDIYTAPMHTSMSAEFNAPMSDGVTFMQHGVPVSGFSSTDMGAGDSVTISVDNKNKSRAMDVLRANGGSL